MEKEYFGDLKKVVKQNRVEFENLLTGEVTVATDTKAILEEKIASVGNGNAPEDLNTVLVRILKNIPKFVSSDMQEYGPFAANEIKKLPKKEAELLSKKQFVEMI
jgi:hypothetical protein